MPNRDFNTVDKLVVNFDQAVRTLFGKPRTTERRNPSLDVNDGELDASEKDRIVRLMRINHTGEVCAQALYQGQSLTARDPATRASMERSAAEENDHLDWCETRVHELGGRLSLLNPLWYAGSFCIGAAAGLAGDKWSLGFVVETEKQVEDHLAEHLEQLPPSDSRSRVILEQMKKDEIRHGEKARAYGGAELPKPLQAAMTLAAKVMTRAVYWI